MAKLYFRYGAMNSGKSTLLMQVAHNYEERGMGVLVMKPGTDTKGGISVVSRLGVSRPVDVVIGAEDDCRLLVERVQAARPVHCVLVDEAQFLAPAQADQLLAVALDRNVPVICYGLRTDFRGNGFPGSRRLLLIAHSLEELKTICRCGRKAIFNARKINGHYVFEGTQVAIDGQDAVEYEALCGQCYFAERRAAGLSALDGLTEPVSESGAQAVGGVNPIV